MSWWELQGDIWHVTRLQYTVRAIFLIWWSAKSGYRSPNQVIVSFVGNYMLRYINKKMIVLYLSFDVYITMIICSHTFKQYLMWVQCEMDNINCQCCSISCCDYLHNYITITFLFVSCHFTGPDPITPCSYQLIWSML